MGRLGITLACGVYDRTRALADGSVAPEGVDLNFLPLAPSETFVRMLAHAEFEASEFSLSNYLMGHSRGDDRFIGIPVFTYRAFRHSMIWVHTEAGIVEPVDLMGKRVGIPEYAVTALVYIRGMLQHEYGVSPERIHWFRTRRERAQLRLPPEIRVDDLSPDQTAEELLKRRQLDAIISFHTPTAFSDGSLPVRRLFTNVRDTEMAYYRRTSIFPIMHLVVVRRDVYTRNPWVASSLAKAFKEAKEASYMGLEKDSLTVSSSLTPWTRIHMEEAQQVFEGDLYPYGVTGNRVTLEAAARYCYEQHLSEREVVLDDAGLFAPEAVTMLEGRV